jgi:hypothetical protein
VGVLRLRAGQVETLWDELLPVEARGVAEDLAGIDEFLRDPALLEPIAVHWERGALERGRPTIAMESYVRLMVVKQRSGWGTKRWCGRCRTRCICGASAWSGCRGGCRTSRRCAS